MIWDQVRCIRARDRDEPSPTSPLCGDASAEQALKIDCTARLRRVKAGDNTLLRSPTQLVPLETMRSIFRRTDRSYFPVTTSN